MACRRSLRAHWLTTRTGHLFVFRGRRGDRIKVLWWDGDGLCLFAKRLERGRFVWPRAVRQARAGPLLEDLHRWFHARLSKLSRKSPLAIAIRYGSTHSDHSPPRYVLSLTPGGRHMSSLRNLDAPYFEPHAPVADEAIEASKSAVSCGPFLIAGCSPHISARSEWSFVSANSTLASGATDYYA
jgi:IS66 Orf2 like protein